jgi:hypothetical protein
MEVIILIVIGIYFHIMVSNRNSISHDVRIFISNTTGGATSRSRNCLPFRLFVEFMFRFFLFAFKIRTLTDSTKETLDVELFATAIGHTYLYGAV